MCEFLHLVIQHAMRMRRIVICGLHRYAIFFPLFLINGTIFEKQKVTEHKICVLNLFTTFAVSISHSKEK